MLKKLNPAVKVFILIIFPVVFFFGTICIGRFSVSLPEVFECLKAAVTGDMSSVDQKTYTIVVNIRAQRALSGVLVGAALAASGACFQSLFRNPLVSPGMLGVSSGSGFGAALAIIIFGTTIWSTTFSFAFGILAVLLSYMVGKIAGGSPTVTLVLGGSIIQSIFSAMLSLLKYLADTESQLPAITFWLMGSLASTKATDLLLSGIPMLIGMAGMLAMRYRLNVLSMGDREAKTLGLNVGASKAGVIASATLATAGAVAVSGVIGWVGLIVPHIGRMLFGNDNRWLIPASMSVGACFMVLVDTICRSIASSEIPLGIITAIVGGPFFIYLLRKTKGGGW